MNNKIGERSEPKEGDVLEQLTGKIRQEFPDLSFSEAQLVEEGLDNWVVILDDKWVFRFVRSEEYIKPFSREAWLLEEIRNKLPIEVPEYEYVSKEKDFGGYKMLKGDELSTEALKSLPEETKGKIAQELGEFLSALHSLPQEPAAKDHDWRSPNYFSERYYQRRHAVFADNAPPGLLEKLDKFFEEFVKIKYPQEKVVHTELWTRHILLSEGKTNISGIIDFGEMAVGDPACDFAGLWAYGEDFLKKVMEHYNQEKDDGFVERSRYYYVRYLIDRLYRKYDWRQDPKELELNLEKYLSQIQI